MKIWKKFIGELDGGAAEFGREDVLVRVVEGIEGLVVRGRKGEVSLPPAVEVQVETTGPIDVLAALCDAPEFRREVEERLQNRVLDLEAHRLPSVRVQVQHGGSNRVTVTAASRDSRLRLRVEGGRFDGAVHVLPVAQAELRLGRGEWHGGDGHFRNDFSITDEDAWVSRGAARVYVRGRDVTVESTGQGEDLVVLRAGRPNARPNRSATGRIEIQAGDRFEIRGPGGVKVVIHLEEQGA